MNRILGLRFAALCVLCAVLAAPARGDAKTSEAPGERVAVVNGVPLERVDLDKEVFLVQRSLLGQGQPLTCNQIASIRSEVLESLIRRELLFQDSRKAGIKPDETAISKEIAALKQQFASDSEYRNELARRNISEEALRSQLARNSALQQYLDRQFASKVSVNDAEMVAYYEGHLDMFKQPLQVRASHILIKVDPAWNDARKREARRKADEILKSLKKGQDFAALAREQSDGPTRTNGGDLGYVRSGQLAPELEQAVFGLKTGEVSDVVETGYGYHLFKVIDRKPATVLAYDAVKEQIRQHLVQERAKQDAELYAKGLREKASVEILLRDEVTTAKRP